MKKKKNCHSVFERIQWSKNIVAFNHNVTIALWKLCIAVQMLKTTLWDYTSKSTQPLNELTSWKLHKKKFHREKKCVCQRICKWHSNGIFFVLFIHWFYKSRYFCEKIAVKKQKNKKLQSEQIAVWRITNVISIYNSIGIDKTLTWVKVIILLKKTKKSTNV